MSHGDVIGLDLGGTDLKAARVARDGAIEAFVKLPSRAQESADGPLLAMDAALAELRRPDQPLLAVGLGTPGVVDPDDGRLIGHTPHLPHWQALPLRSMLAERFGTRVAVDNDANAAALAEQRVGAARGARVAVMVTLGTGMGCGIIVNGLPLRGAWGGAGELGHIPLGHSGSRCACGIADCVEPEASGSGLARMAAEAGLKDCDAAAVFALAAAGDRVARELVDRFSDRVGAVLAVAINVLNPDVVVIGGGVANAGDSLLVPVRAALDRYALASHRRGLRVLPAELGERAGSVGAGLLAWDALVSGAGPAPDHGAVRSRSGRSA